MLSPEQMQRQQLRDSIEALANSFDDVGETLKRIERDLDSLGGFLFAVRDELSRGLPKTVSAAGTAEGRTD